MGNLTSSCEIISNKNKNFVISLLPNNYNFDDTFEILFNEKSSSLIFYIKTFIKTFYQKN